MEQHIITALVANHSGVLTRISGLFSRRGYNIDSLSVCTTENPKLSRMTIAANGDSATIEQIIRQLDKLVDVTKVTELSASDSLKRELILIKIKLSAKERPEIESTCNIYKAKMIDLSPTSVVLELTGEPNKIDAFINIVSPYGILEMIRTGLTALARGESTISEIKDYNDLV